MDINFFISDNFVARKTSDIIIICNSKESLTSRFNEYAVTAGISNEDDITFLVTVAKARLIAAAETTCAVELFVRGETAANPPRRIILALLPLQYSRHNTPSRSHSVASTIKAHKGSSKDLTVILAPSDNHYLFPQALSVSRQFSSYFLKKPSSAETEEMKVNVVLHFNSAPFGFACLLQKLTNLSKGIRLAQRLVDSPPNVLHTDAYVQECIIVANRLGCAIKIIQGVDLETQGFGGLWGVGKSSEHLPALVILSHLEDDKDAKSICMVGKGIVYDTGGLSIKTGGGMVGMKTDMGGSAAVLGAFEAAVSSGVKGNYHALLCIAENSVGPLSTRPDDVHKLLSGKTVEVNNTDAEGRLVLSDGVFYASSFLNPKAIIDIATLTGAQLVATGRNHAAIYCNDDELEALAIRAGKSTGDLVHPIPYCPEFYKPEYKSQVADMKNSVADRMNAQASCAGQFIGNNIEEYLSDGGKWLHVDMAGPCNVGDRATGYGVALLFQLLQDI